MDQPIFKEKINAYKRDIQDLKEALNDLGVMGMTVTNVMGCGVQKGQPANYRGVPYTPSLLPKIKVETVISEVPVDAVVDVAKRVLRTGEIGDGKIFVYPVSNVIRIRNGDEGVTALDNQP